MATVLVEGLTGIVKTTLAGFGLNLATWTDQAISMVLGLVVAIAGKVDFFAVVSEVVGMQFNFPAALGILLSGLILARGSNGVHDLFKTLNPNIKAMKIW
jgi:hypothetical protein